ncbi:hypothetical protein K6U06_17035 [Acidiferrimicrobium sp. IK]|uniref:hypothetical protein n=1 Tax=Acidiferrimicrobium sp. IK TaxID=2871700 RepID=UPI0021CAEA3A|nr:hypothetical protein [Acidiferrimicrobium sp. IK]MCU4186077.1 hypothetical protein [Acidiferrimicrobium sp. IK]
MLVAGVIGAVVVGGGGGRLPGGASESGGHPSGHSATTAAGPTGTATIPVTTLPPAAGSAPSSATLSANLLAFADLGGFYDPVPADSSRQLAASPCLSQLAPTGAATSASTYFAGPARGSLPAINEVVAGYNGAAATAAYAHDVSVLQHCSPVTVTVAGATATLRLAPVANTLPASDTESAFGGTGVVQGRTWSVDIGLVAQPQVVLLVIYIDTVPPSNAIYGNFPSTLAAALGKLA